MSLWAVVIAGGSGTRFWPASTDARPKQFLPLAGDPDAPLLATTVERIAPVVDPSRILIATGERLRDATHAVVPEVPRENVLAEPVARNTAPCIGWATHVAMRRDPDAVVMVFPADHAVEDEATFRDVIVEAAGLAESGRIVTIGLEPTRPETGFGYIEVGDRLGGRAFEVKRFVEKPDRARAEEFVAGKKHLWNGGMFFFRASVLSSEIATHLPELASGLAKIDEAAKSGDETSALRAIFPTLPSISIDHGVMERARSLVVVRASFGWSDVGSWEAAWELAAKDEAGNAAPADAIVIEARRNLVRDLRTDAKTNPKTIALLGVDDLVVVETDDALLVLPRSRAQDVRKIVEAKKSPK